MKLFSLRKPIVFNAKGIFVEDLAYNYHYTLKGDFWVVEGVDASTKWEYSLFYNKKGKFQYVLLKRHSQRCALTLWTENYDIYEKQRVKANGDRFLVIAKYLTDKTVKHKLISKSFELKVDGVTQQENFQLTENRWKSTGKIDLRKTWL